MKQHEKQKTKSTPHIVSKKKEHVKKPVEYHKYFLWGILATVAIIYSNCLHSDILNFDDNDYFYNSPDIIHLSFQSIKNYFTHYYVIMYQPLPVLTFAINHALSGLNTFPMHFLNLFFHLLNVYLVYRFVHSLFGNKNMALVAALLFGIHPMSVEAVAWISARSSVMYTCFYLLSLNCYVQYLQNNFQKKYLLYAGLFFLLSVFSKTQAVTLPVVLMLVDYYTGRKFLSTKILLEKIPFFLISIALGIVTLMNSATMKNITEGMLISYSPVDVFFLVCYSFAFYLFKLFLPFNLCSIYVYPPKDNGMLPMEYYISLLIVLLFAYFIFRNRKNKTILFGAALFLITISINIQLLPSRLFIVADRYSYFPYIGLYIMLFASIMWLKENRKGFYIKYSNAPIIALIIYFFFFSATSYSRTDVWKNDGELMSDIISKNAPVPYIQRAYGTRGLYYKAHMMMPEAMSDFTEAINLNPSDSRSHCNRAYGYILMKEYNNAVADLDTAIGFDSTSALLYSVRAQAKINLKDLDGGFSDCTLGLKYDSAFADLYNTRAAIDFEKKDLTTCESDLNNAIKYSPKNGDYYKNRGQLFLALNRKEQACADWETASRLGNNDADAMSRENCR